MCKHSAHLLLLSIRSVFIQLFFAERLEFYLFDLLRQLLRLQNPIVTRLSIQLVLITHRLMICFDFRLDLRFDCLHFALRFLNFFAMQVLLFISFLLKLELPLCHQHRLLL